MSGHYQHRIYSTTAYHSSNSLEELVPKGAYTRLDEKVQVARDRGKQRCAGGEGSTLVSIEQRKSYGIGGAGNIRKPSDIIYPPRLNADGTPRQSVWSSMSVSPGLSPDGKRVTFMNLFGRRSSPTEAPSAAPVKENQERVHLSGSDLTRKKKFEVEQSCR